MSEAILPRKRNLDAAATSTLHASAVVWFVPTLIGQWFFAYHIAATYVATASSGDFAAWNKRLFVGFVAGDPIGNMALVAHLLLALVITVGGTLQLIPQIRTRAPAFHRWNGRIYIGIAFVTSIAGIYMIWTRDTFGGILVNDVGVSLNGVLIVIFAAITLRHAIARNIEVHQRWALRTFVVVSGVWFLRVIYAFLDAVPGRTPGVADDMTGPSNVVLNFASYLLPLAVLELYFRAKRSPHAAARLGTAVLVLVAAVATSIGVYGRIKGWIT